MPVHSTRSIVASSHGVKNTLSCMLCLQISLDPAPMAAQASCSAGAPSRRGRRSHVLLSHCVGSRVERRTGGEADRFCLRLSADGRAGTAEGVPLPLVGGIPRLRDKRAVPPSRGGEAPWLRPSGGCSTLLPSRSVPEYPPVARREARQFVASSSDSVLVAVLPCVIYFLFALTERAEPVVLWGGAAAHLPCSSPGLCWRRRRRQLALVSWSFAAGDRLGAARIFLPLFSFSRPTPIPFFAHGLSAIFARFLAKPWCFPVIGGFPVLLVLRFAS